MLVLGDAVADEILRPALRYVQHVAAIDGRQSVLSLSQYPLRSFTCLSHDDEDLHPDRFVEGTVYLPVLQATAIMGLVGVRQSEDGQWKAVVFSHLSRENLRAFEVADRSADRDGDREIRILSLDSLGGHYLWVTCDEPHFIRRRDDSILELEPFLAELRELAVSARENAVWWSQQLRKGSRVR